MPSQYLSSYQGSIQKYLSIIASVHQIDAQGSYVWSLDDRTIVTESMFLRMFIAWEGFLEATFIHYMLGNSSISGTIFARYANPVNDTHANQILVGTNRYVDWSNPDIVCKLANLFFNNGGPYDQVIIAIKQDVFDLKIIRNAAAHISSTTTQHLNNLGNRKLGSARASYTVYDLILATDPQYPNNTILQTYLDTLEGAVLQIVT